MPTFTTPPPPSDSRKVGTWGCGTEGDKQERSDDIGRLVGRAAAFEASIDLLRRVAPTSVTVLLTGETGVGKERFARALHALSPRSGAAFVAVNCAALPEELIESELFGAEKGAFTGASGTRAGRFERADGGTLFLDELGEMPVAAQAKLLRVLESGEVERLGSTTSIRLNVRVVAATNIDLDAAVRQGTFRRDLFYRLNVYPIRIPPLRERTDDIEPLARHMLLHFNAVHQKHVLGFTARALEAMRHHAWPGNVRELENRIERGHVLTAPGQWVDADHLFLSNPVPNNSSAAQAVSAQHNNSTLYDEFTRRGLGLEQFTAVLMHEAVLRHEGNLAAAARALGITRPQLSYRLLRQRDTAPR